ncbi:MAG: hypothetical protein ACK5XN_38250, partial [Bacteroidota bacterium]
VNDIMPKAMDYISEKGWKQFNLPDFASSQSIAFYELIKIIPSKDDFIGIMIDWMEVVAAKDLEDVDANDLVFELFMQRFENLYPYRRAMQSIGFASILYPSSFLPYTSKWLCNLYTYFGSWDFVAKYLQILPTWFADEQGLSSTMARVNAISNEFQD